MKLKSPKKLNEIFVPIDSTSYMLCTTLKCLKPRVLHLVNRRSLFFFSSEKTPTLALLFSGSFPFNVEIQLKLLFKENTQVL